MALTESSRAVWTDVRTAITSPVREVGWPILLTGSLTLAIIWIVQLLVYALLIPADFPLNPTITYTQEQQLDLARAYVYSTFAFLILMTPVFGYLLWRIQCWLRPPRSEAEAKARSPSLGAFLRRGFKFSVIGTAFLFLPNTLTTAAFGSWAMDIVSVLSVVFGQQVATILAWVVMSFIGLYIFPVIIIRFARRNRLSDLVTSGWYTLTLRNRQYAVLATAGAIVLFANQLLGMVIVWFFLDAVPLLVVIQGGALRWDFLATQLLTAFVSFYAITGTYYLYSDQWRRVHEALYLAHERSSRGTITGWLATAEAESRADVLVEMASSHRFPRLRHDFTTQSRLEQYGVVTRSNPPSTSQPSTPASVIAAIEPNDPQNTEAPPSSTTDLTRSSSGLEPAPIKSRSEILPTDPVPKQRSPSMSESVRYLWEADNRLHTVVIGGFLVVLVWALLPALLLGGFLIEVLRRTATGELSPPSFSNWTKLLGDGFKAAGIVAVYSAGLLAIISILVAIEMAVFSMIATDLPTELVLLTGVLGSLTMMLLITYITPAALASYAEAGSIDAGFDRSRLGPMLRSRVYAVSWFKAGLLFGSALALSVGLSLTIIGLLVAPLLIFAGAVSAAVLIGRSWEQHRSVSIPDNTPSVERPPA